MIAAKARGIYDEEAKERQTRKPADSVPETFPEQTKGEARDKARLGPTLWKHFHKVQEASPATRPASHRILLWKHFHNKTSPKRKDSFRIL